MIAVVTLVALLGVTLGLFFTKRARFQGRITACSRNLERIGRAMSEYAQEHEGSLPYARMVYSQRNQKTWDTLLKPYLKEDVPKTNGPVTLASRARDRELGPFFHCPSDTLRRSAGHLPRSYSMSHHDMRPKNWPPGPTNATGVGLGWSFGPDGKKPPSPTVYNFEHTNQQASVKLSMIPEPKDTLLATEQIQTNNNLWAATRTTIRTTGEHLATNLISMSAFHGGKFNYLMVDGHVETLLPGQTVGPAGEVGTNAMKHDGIWTIKPGD